MNAAYRRLRLWKWLQVIVIFVIVFYILPVYAADVVKVGVYDNYPKVFINDAGKPDGFFIDIIEEIAKREGWHLQYVPMLWSEGFEKLRTGEIDLMSDVVYREERAEYLSFHDEPVLSQWTQVFARSGSRISSVLDLDGKRIAVLKGSVQYAALQKHVEGFGLYVSIIPYNELDEVYQAVATGKADAMVTNNINGMAESGKYNLENTAVVYNPSTVFFATWKGTNLHLLQAIDKQLVLLKQDTTSRYYQSWSKWTSEKIRFKIPFWLAIAGAMLGAALIVSVIATLLLKHQVRVRTRELLLINSEMEERIFQRTLKLEEAMEKAQEADYLKSAFLATMSHELRTPLNSIIGFTGIMLQELAGPLTEEQHKQMTIVQNNSRHLLALINEILDLSKIEAGQFDLDYSKFMLNVSIVKSLKLVQPLANRKGLYLRFHSDDDLGMIYGDQRRLEQIILNLLSNAIKFTQHGSVSIATTKRNDEYEISVSDTGIGIKPEQLSDIFLPFSQIDNGLARKYDGTGLGLSICSKLINLMGGAISVESVHGEGSTFSIKLPQRKESKL
ncbi:MAG: sensor histidine kinase [Candidatus Cloacimonetes bacterium HGW-Cloacimonetes-1]|nr:MAG: sensor histidine kinase [Candidatus Cloacimonetes bacterium HGW-Cloacimonetes-1]